MQTKLNVFLYKSATVANLLGFTCGIALSWTSPVLPKLNGTIDPPSLGQPITPSEESWIVALLSLGAMVGPIFAGPIADILGRKKSLIIFSCPILGSFLMMALSETVILFYIGRLMMGVGVGGILMVLPLYLVEICEDHNRGTLGCMVGVFMTDTFFVRYWSLLLRFKFLLNLFIPESPHYLAAANKQNELIKCLVKLRKKAPEEVEKEAFALTHTIQVLNQRKGGVFELFLKKSPRRALLISLSLLTLQQFSGINAVLAYMQPIFHSTGSALSPELSAVLIGTIQVFTTIAAAGLADKVGRKVLLLISMVGSAMSLILLGGYFFLLEKQVYVQTGSWLPVLSLVFFVVVFNLGLAIVPWAMTAELFPNNVKSIALSLTTIFSFAGAFIVTLSFPQLVKALGMAQSFWVFAAICVLGSVFVFFKVPETKGRSLQEIQLLLEH